MVSACQKCALILLLGIPFALMGQSTLTVKYFGLTVHPFGDNSAALMPYKLDNDAKYVLNAGGFIGYERYIYEDFLALKCIQGVFTDCSGGLAGVSHFGVRGVLIDTKSHRLSFGLGPALLYRDSWYRFGGRYQSAGFFNDYKSRNLGDIQWKLFFLAFEFEYDHSINHNNDLSLSFTPGIPMACVLSIGLKHWFSKDFKKNYKLAL
jgi:hypothetical protein